MGSGILMKVLFCERESFGSSREEASEGHVRVYVVRDLQSKFEMEANYMNHPLFGILLRTYSEEDLEYYDEATLRIPCEVGLFKYLGHLLEVSDPSAHYMELSYIVSRYHAAKYLVHLGLPLSGVFLDRVSLNDTAPQELGFLYWRNLIHCQPQKLCCLKELFFCTEEVMGESPAILLHHEDSREENHRVRA